MKLIPFLVALAFAGSATAQTASTPAPQENAGLKAQVLLDRAHFAVGEIDGEVGSTTKSAVKFFQTARNLPVTGELDEATLAALEDGQPILRTHTLSAEDVSGPFGGKPKYANVMEKLGEVFQSSPDLLKQLNPDSGFGAGDTIQVPAVGGPLNGRIAKIVVDTSDKTLQVFDSAGQLLGHYPTTLGSEESIPYGEHKIVSATRNPYYRRVLRPSGKVRAMNGGPNNYVGSMWMALTERHYGIHGSPEPSKISKQQSAGCIRLTNWDANEVAAAIVKNAVVVVQE